MYPMALLATRRHPAERYSARDAGGTERLVRDSKDPCGPVLVFAPAVWGAFVRDIKAGKYSPR